MTPSQTSTTRPLDPRIRKLVTGLLGLLGLCALYAVAIALGNLDRIGV